MVCSSRSKPLYRGWCQESPAPSQGDSFRSTSVSGLRCSSLLQLDSFSAGPVSSRLSLQKGAGHLLAPPCTRHSPNVTSTGTKKNPVLYCLHSLSTSSLNGFRSVSEPLGLWRTSTNLKIFLRARQLDSTGCLSVPRHVPASSCRVRVEKSPYTVRTVVCDQDGEVGIRHANSKRRAVGKPSHAVLANFDHLLRHRFSSSQWVSPGSMLSTTVYACWTKAVPFSVLAFEGRVEMARQIFLFDGHHHARLAKG